MHDNDLDQGGGEAVSAPSASGPHRINIRPCKRGMRGQYYTVAYAGATIIPATLNPTGVACRHLVSLGLNGPLEVWDGERPYPRLLIHDLVKAAAITVAEGEAHGPRFVRYREWCGISGNAA